jgi:hypothetical protein
MMQMQTFLAENRSALFNTRIQFFYLKQSFYCRRANTQFATHPSRPGIYHDIGLCDFFMCSAYAELFDKISSMRITYTGRINQTGIDSFDHEYFFNSVALVPAISSRWHAVHFIALVFSKVDFPAFGFPTIATVRHYESRFHI